MINFTIKHSFLLYAFLLVTLTLAAQSHAQENIEDQVRDISNHLMCPVCQGQSVGESNSNLAQDMRGIIRKQLKEGKSKEEILAYFVSSYGEEILASPPPKGINWLLWILPGVAIVVGGVGITLFLYRSQGNKIKETKSQNVKPQADNDYLNRVDQDLKSGDS